MGHAAVITWNLLGRPNSREPSALAEASQRVSTCMSWLRRHLEGAGIDRAVIVFQEVPDGFDALLASATDTKMQVVADALHHVAVATFGPLKVTGKEGIADTSSGTAKRAVRVDVEGLLDEPVRLVGVHWLDRHNLHGDARASKGGKFWSAVRLQWHNPTRPHFIVLGDLNENPFDHALVSRECLWAIRDRRDLDGRSSHIDGNPPLYNPMWQFLPERLSPEHGPHGTIEYLNNDEDGVRWSHIDQILLSPSAVDFLRRVEILVDLDGEKLVSPRGVPDRRRASDHLPVMAILGEPNV